MPDDNEHVPPAVPAEKPVFDADDRPRLVSSSELMCGRREIWIQHGDAVYRLRVTSADKLYLTK
ncbi:Hemin uptake protein hemP [Rosistilla ulvae]|uniref:Hemin uptake protein hemP n=1 Tax=Rosistilla ulvae TaxID=1930277 RepID=A0A517M0K5_9BACT|nr:Hemin uptake protein hemP [Rosistilla ulvae]